MNQLIEQTRQALLAKVDQRLLPVVQQVVEQGKRVMYSDQTRELAMKELRQATEPEGIGAAVAKLAAILLNQSKNTIPPQVLFPAAMQLMLEALQLLEDAGGLQVDNEMLAQCAQATGSAFLQMMGVTPEKLQSLVDKQGAKGAAPSGPTAAPGPVIAGGMGG